MSNPPSPPGRSDWTKRLSPSLEIWGRSSFPVELMTAPRLIGVDQSELREAFSSSAASERDGPGPTGPLPASQAATSAVKATSDATALSDFIPTSGDVFACVSANP